MLSLEVLPTSSNPRWNKESFIHSFILVIFFFYFPLKVAGESPRPPALWQRVSNWISVRLFNWSFIFPLQASNTSRLLKMYADLDPRVRTLVVGLRHWARVSQWRVYLQVKSKNRMNSFNTFLQQPRTKPVETRYKTTCFSVILIKMHIVANWSAVLRGRHGSGFGRYNFGRDDFLATWPVADGENLEAYFVLFREDGNMTQNKIDETVSTVLSEVVVKFQKLSTKRIGFHLLRNIKDRILSQT